MFIYFMESRKVIKFGSSSYVVTLPFEWIKRHNLEKGSNLNIVENDSTLLLSVEKVVKEKNAIIKIDKVPMKILNRELISYYLKNYKYIKLEGKNIFDKLDDIKVLKEKLSSVEIVELNKDYIVLKDLTSPDELNVCSIIQEIVEMEKILFDEFITIESQNRQHFISTLDTNINKLSFLAFKAINYNLDVLHNPAEAKDAIHYHRIVSAFETIGDILKRVTRYLKGEDERQVHLVNKQLSFLREYFIFVTNLLNENINLNENLKVQQDKKQSLLREFEQMRGEFENIKLYLVVTQLFKDIMGQLDTIVLSVIDLRCR